MSANLNIIYLNESNNIYGGACFINNREWPRNNCRW